jgi:glutamine amidotransferase
LGVTEAVISNNQQDILSANKLILPGVGAFNKAMLHIKQLHLDKCLYAAIIENKTPVLGICLGMQLMGLSSTENGYNTGLGYIKGKIDIFNNQLVKIPHVGFNQVAVNNQFKLYYGMSGMMDFYFSHSYKMENNTDIDACLCHYHSPFVASYEKNNIAGVQFHPELSQRNGLQLIKNFLERF